MSNIFSRFHKNSSGSSSVSNGLKPKKGGWRQFLKWFGIILIIFVVALAVLIWAEPHTRFFVKALIGSKIMKTQTQRYENQVKADKYGGTTPEQTYQMFVEALKQQDIDLACNYFVIDKRDECKDLFNYVKKNNKWDIMLDDVLNSEKVVLLDGQDTYSFELFNKNHEQVAHVILIEPKTADSPTPISNIWKIYEF